MHYLFYNILISIAAPLARVYLYFRKRYRPLLARFRPPVPDTARRAIWVHACSVGEVATAGPFLEALHKQFPEQKLLLTSSTITGYEQAQKRADRVKVTWCPFDTRRAVKHFLRAARPAALVLIETELWPNLLRECARADVPVVLVNGRLSDKHFPRYRRMGALMRQALQHLSSAGVQNERYAELLRRLGAPANRIHVTGNAKFDAVRTDVPPKDRARTRQSAGIPADAPVLVFGSTRPGDETLAAQCWQTLKEKYPALHLVIAPRHVRRAAAVCDCFEEAVQLRSQNDSASQSGAPRVLIVDTLGELVTFYAIASVAVVGGSFYPGVEGHNPLEPAALGVPTVFGPHMSNFEEPARVLRQARGAVQVDAPEALHTALQTLLNDPAEQRHTGTRARRAVLQHQGAVQANIALVAELLGDQAAPR